MKTFLDVLRFELRLHLSSPLLWGIALVFLVLHLLTLTRTGINLGDNEQIAINSVWLIFQTEIALGVLGMVPSIAFAVMALTRDHELRTAELFFTTPAPAAAFALGRFCAATLMAVLIGTVGLLGALAGSFMPWLDPERLTPFAWQPWLVVYATLVVPNLVVFCALFFAVAALTRSAALTFCVALTALVLDAVLFGSRAGEAPFWTILADPFGALAVAEVSRYWTVAELNTLLPIALLLPNRLVWLSVALAAVVFTVWRYRLELPKASGRRVLRKSEAMAPAHRMHERVVQLPHFDAGATWRQLIAQLRMDWRGVWQSPLFWVVLVLTMLSAWDDGSGLISRIAGIPVYPVTSLMLGLFRFSLLPFLVTAILYFAAALVYRERDSGVHDIVGALPCPDWIQVTSKTITLCGIVLLLFLLSIGVSLAVQEAADFHDHAPAVFLQGAFIYNGFHFCMLAVLSTLVLILSPGRWSGMVLALLTYIALAALPVLGFEHLLYGFRIPYVVHSDMNGFGHFRLQTWSLLAYWGAFCVLLMLAGHLLYPRGSAATWKERLRDARNRLTRPILATGSVAALAFAGMGAFIFYNTNVLNDYVTSAESLAAQARYERDYGLYRDLPAPSVIDPDVQMDLYASERRLVSRGSAGLRNHHAEALSDFVLSVDKRNRVEALSVDGATLVASDPAQGFYLFRSDAPFAPGDVLPMHWHTVRENRGFVNANPDNEVIANGTYIRNAMAPIPGYCADCELTTDRARFGLPPAPRMPTLGDPAHLGDFVPGLNSRSSFHVVYGTDADQTAVGPGLLNRVWEENGRRYFDYSLEGPVWPLVVILSARYEIARDSWNGVALEVYHDDQHPWNVQAMLETAKKGLAYYSREFAPFPLPYYRMAEYARYRTNVQAGAGLIAYSEANGFVTDLREWAPDMDYATLHELAHQWWGNVYGANMQGRQFLNEGLAQYSTFMAYKVYAEPQYLRRILLDTHNGYLDSRSADPLAEMPVFKTEDQRHISYNKAPLALFALQELIGADKVNGALRAYHARFVDMKPPFPTSLDVLEELRKAAGPEYQQWITDQFEKVMLYDTGVESVSVQAQNSGYAVTVDVSAHQYEADALGNETEVPLDTWFEVAVFAQSDLPLIEQEPLYKAFHKLRSGTQQLALSVAQQPATVVVDPYYLMLDRRRANNTSALAQ
jgi:ABC-type transport system involved in multi-copper enzyme maturation permease subunit